MHSKERICTKQGEEVYIVREGSMEKSVGHILITTETVGMLVLARALTVSWIMIQNK